MLRPTHRTTLAALCVLLSGCAAGGGATQGANPAAPSSGGAPTIIKIGETAGIPAAFLAYGEERGIFQRQGLDLQVDTAAGGAAVIPSVVSGNYQFGGSNTTSVLLAKDRKLPISVVAPGTFATERAGEDFSAVLVSASSPIRSANDLAGKKIAVNTLKNVGDVTIKAALQARGVDPSGIEFVEVGFPDMLAALEAGRVDAAWEIEPFVTSGTGRGFRAVLWPYVEARPGLQIGSFVASNRYVQEQPKAVEAFRAGVAATAQEINADPQAFRAALPRLQKMSPEAAQKMVLPVWKGTVDTPSLQFMADKMREYGLVEGAVDVGGVVAPGAAG